MDNNNTHRAFPMTFDFAEGSSLVNEILAGKVIETLEDLRTILVMLEGDAPKDGQGYRKVFFFTQGHKSFVRGYIFPSLLQFLRRGKTISDSSFLLFTAKEVIGTSDDRLLFPLMMDLEVLLANGAPAHGAQGAHFLQDSVTAGFKISDRVHDILHC